MSLNSAKPKRRQIGASNESRSANSFPRPRMYSREPPKTWRLIRGKLGWKPVEIDSKVHAFNRRFGVYEISTRNCIFLAKGRIYACSISLAFNL